MKIAINGFGRIGRLTFRHLIKNEGVEVVAINDLTDNATLAHLLKYDSTQGKFDGTVAFDDHSLTVNGKRINAYAMRNPAELPWAELGVDVVLECTGIFLKKKEAEMHLQAGAKKVILSAPAKGDGFQTIVMGVNSANIDKSLKLFSNASCTTNCLSPLVKVLEDNYGIENGTMTTIHAYTNDQRILDAPHKDLRRARTAAVNLVPTSTGAAVAVSEVIPSIKGKIMATAVRVPLPTGSMTELTVTVKTPTSVADVNAKFKEAADADFKGVLEFCTDPIVSSDIVGNTNSCIYDSELTAVQGGTLVKVVGWYDNEAGYSARLADLATMVL